EPLVRNTAAMVERTLHLGVALEIEGPKPGAESLVVEADANQLQQALINLALNARDALIQQEALAWRQQQGGSEEDLGAMGQELSASRRLVFRLHTALVSDELPSFPQNVPPGDYVVLEVVDHGCGMTPEVLSQAIDPFFTTKEVGKGTGLG